MGNKVTHIFDKLTNFVANLGTDRDKASHSTYSEVFLSDIQLQIAYRNAWIPRKVVDIVAEDAGRNWRCWKGVDAKQIAKIETLEKNLNLRAKVIEAMKKARLFGGAAIYISTSDGDVSKPLNGTETIRQLTVMNARELSAGEYERDPDSPYYGQPASYTIAGSDIIIHPSRIARFIGKEILDEEIGVRTLLYKGWGDSVLQSLYETMLQADDTAANVTSLVFEAKVDVVKIPNLMDGLEDPDYENRLLTRATLAAKGKGINGTLLLDAEEDYQTKTANFSGLKDIWLTALQVVSGACDIPLTRLLGQSPGGLQASGDSDMRNYYDMVSSQQELDIGPALVVLDKLLLNTAGVSEAAYYEWRPLWQPSDKELAEIGKQTAETINILNTTQLYDPEQLSAASIAMLEERGVISGLDGGEGDFSEEPGGDDLIAVCDMAFTDMEPRPLYVSRKVMNVEQITEWFASQGVTVSNQNLHVTITYSSNPVDWMKMGTCYSPDRDGWLRVPAGGPRSMEILSTDLVLEFTHDDLVWRHDEMVRKGASYDYASYKPHITLVYDHSPGVSNGQAKGIEPYRGPIILGPEVFEEL